MISFLERLRVVKAIPTSRCLILLAWHFWILPWQISCSRKIGEAKRIVFTVLNRKDVVHRTKLYPESSIEVRFFCRGMEYCIGIVTTTDYSKNEFEKFQLRGSDNLFDDFLLY